MRNMQLNATSLRHPQRASERFASECLEHDAHAALGEHRDILVAALQDDRHAPASLSTNNGGRCIARMFNIRKMSCQCSSPSADKSPNWGHKRQHKRKAALTRRCSGRRSWYEERSKRKQRRGSRHATQSLSTMRGSRHATQRHTRRKSGACGENVTIAKACPMIPTHGCDVRLRACLLCLVAQRPPDIRHGRRGPRCPAEVIAGKL